MPCDRKLKAGQTISQRAAEVRVAAARIDALIAAGRVKPTVGRQGAVTFTGLSDSDRDGLTDACIYRRVMASGSAGARQALSRAEQLAGRGVDRGVVARGVHSHDGGRTWHQRG